MSARKASASKFEAESRAQIATRQGEGLRPLPLTPPDSDVSAFGGPILNGNRLKTSEFWLGSSDQVKVAAIELWLFAWRQRPAASLPNDAAILSRVCGLPVKRVTSALTGDARFTPFHGFVLCEDGRWYHPVLAGDATRAWKTRLAREVAARHRYQKETIGGVLGGIGRRGRRFPEPEDDY